MLFPFSTGTEPGFPFSSLSDGIAVKSIVWAGFAVAFSALQPATAERYVSDQLIVSSNFFDSAWLDGTLWFTIANDNEALDPGL